MVLEPLLAELRARSAEPQPLAARVPVDALPTPALLLDEGAFERNVARMAEFLTGKGKGFRPHAKTHKCPIIARRQIEAGAVGVCAAKVSEAAALVSAGVEDVLITSALLSREKVDLLIDLARTARMAVVVDSTAGLDLIEQALAAAVAEGDVRLDVLIDLDVDMGRTGTRSDDEMLTLAERVTAHPHLRFAGVQHYAGHVMHIEGHDARRDKSLALWDRIAERVGKLEAAGYPPGIVTGCGTGTYDIDCEVEIVTDLQVGSYIFMDQEYRLIGGRTGPLFEDFEVALTIATTAISQPMSKTVTVDGGYKVFASDSVNPEPLDLAGSRFRFAGDEHGVLILGEGSQQPVLGSVQRFVTPHCDPTVNLHDAYWVHRDGDVHARWPITARGCSW